MSHNHIQPINSNCDFTNLVGNMKFGNNLFGLLISTRVGLLKNHNRFTQCDELR